MIIPDVTKRALACCRHLLVGASTALVWLLVVSAAVLALTGCQSGPSSPTDPAAGVQSGPKFRSRTDSKPRPDAIPPAILDVVTLTEPEPLQPAEPHLPQPPPETQERTPSLEPILGQTEPFGLPLDWKKPSWISWESWSRFNGLGEPLRTRENPERFELHATNLVMQIEAGSQMAYLNGLAFWLGFPPKLINGTLHIHSLDAVKSLQPLLGPHQLLLNGNRRIVLDPGHGGADSGARSTQRISYEKDYTLDWAVRLAELLEASGWHVFLTRTNDVFISLADRVALADRVHADLFLSLHFNSADPTRQAHGLETYLLTPTGMPSNLTRDYNDDMSLVFANNTYDTFNLQLAWNLHAALIRATHAQDRGVRRARFMSVLRTQNRPAVLIEGGFLSNPNEAARIATPAYRQRLAEAVADALK